METRRGILAMIAACTIWGLSPLYYRLLHDVPAVEVLAHRTFWSFVTFAGLVALQGRLGALRGALATPRAVALVALCALMISANWFLFILSVQVGRATEAALGYYIFPLVAVLIGVAVYRERLSSLQWAAVALAAAGVGVLTLGTGAAPWISLVLAVTFGIYGLLKKRTTTGPLVSVTAEVVLLTPLALLWLIWWHASGRGVFGQDMQVTALLAGSGVLTALPLILFSRAARAVPMATVGLLQYLNPTLQFLCATLVLAEPFTPVHAATFGLIWLALALYSASGLAQGRARRRMAMTSAAEAPLSTKSSSEASAKP